MKYISCLFAILLSGCVGVGKFIANTPTYFADYQEHLDVAYGVKPWQKLDIYVPGGEAESYAVIVFLYGGGWSSGSKSDYKFVADRLTREGFIVVIPDYVKYPEAKFPAFVEDAALATAWLNKYISNFKGDAMHMYLLGHSAGAHTGAILITDEDYLNAYNLTPDAYQAFIGLAGPYNFTPEEEKYKKIFGPPERYPLMKASNFVDGTEPRMLLMHGLDDDTVSVQNLQILAQSINQRGGQVTTKAYENMGHLDIIGTFSRAYPLENTVVEDVLKFIQDRE